MEQALRQRVTILPGGKIELQSPDLPVGEEAEVIVLVAPPQARRRNLSEFIGAGKGLFKSADEVDAYINEERDSWER
jgi:hypothetical protein